MNKFITALLATETIQAILQYSDWLIALAIIVGTVIIAAFLAYLARTLFAAYAKKSGTRLDDVMLASFNRPITWGIIILGAYMALLEIQAFRPYIESIGTGFKIVGVLWGLLLIKLLIDAMLVWLSERADMRNARARSLSSGIKKVLQAFIIILGLIFILQILGFEVAPLLTSLGIGGLAVALALQDTLANYFAGLAINAGGILKQGDFIQLPDGKQGTIEKIGWRNSQIRMISNNLIMLPNSQLASSEVINFSSPDEQLSVVISCGVSYKSDLEKVEKVTLEVAKEVLQKTEGGVKEFEPFVRYKEFGDSNINFTIVLRAVDYTYRFILTHEFIKALKKRYDQEGIEIAFPTRTVYNRSDE